MQTAETAWAHYGFRKRFMVSMIAIMLAACAPVLLKPDQTNKLAVGMPAAEVDKVLGRTSLKAAYGFEQDGKRYSVREYSLQTGVEPVWKSYYRPCTNPPWCPGEVPYAMPQMVPYMIVLEDETQKLVAWGTIKEIVASPNPQARKLWPAIINAYSARHENGKN